MRLFPPDPNTTTLNDLTANADGSFDVEDPDLADHLVRFGWGYGPATAADIHLGPAPAADSDVPTDAADAPAARPKSLREMNKPDLVALAEARGLDSTGTVKDLIARLEA